MRKTAVLFISFITVLAQVIVAQQPTNQRAQVVKIGTNEVQLDIVVKDKKGRPVRDLKGDEFEVFEDGIKQNVESFRLITRGTEPESEEPLTPTGTGTNPVTTVRPKVNTTKVKRDTQSSVTAIALVFDRLSPDARRRAQLSALSYLGDSEQQDHYMGVFLINLNMATLQNYTTDSASIRKAIDQAANNAPSTFEPTQGIYNDQTSQTLNLASAAVTSAAAAAGAAGAAGGAGAGAAGAAAGAADVDLQFARMQLRTRETFDRLQRDQQGYSTVNGLLSVISSMRDLPGRKAVMFFSEGVAMPPNVRQQFRSVINNANRANVSLYTVDSAGLRVESTTAASRDEINNRARQRMDNLDQVYTGGAMTMELERNEDLINLNPQNGLIQLAQETGGQFIGDTNNIAPRLKQVDEDLNTYYLLSYLPTNQNYDGGFRNITIKLKRSGLDVQTRKGYYAVDTGGAPVLYYETPVLAALANGSADNSIPMKARHFNFPEAKHTGRTAFEVEMPANVFTFVEDSKKKTYATDFTVLVLVKDANQQVVRKLSTHYTLGGQLDQLAKMKNGLILFYREEDLPPGSYTVEAAAFDMPSKKISISRSTIDIPETDESKLRLSSVVIVKRGEQLPKDNKSDSPFLAGNVLLYPNLGEPISKAAAKQLGFFFTIYTPVGSTFTPGLMVELLHNGKALAAVPLKMPPPNEAGKIPFVGNLPLSSLPPSEYELIVTARSDKGSVTRATKFTVAP